MKRIILWAPLAVFLIFLGIFAFGLKQPEGQMIRSQMIGKPLPPFSLAPATTGVEGVTSADFRDGKPKLLNIFASWCVPCAAEAPQLMQLAKDGVQIEAIAIRDKPEDVAEFLKEHGNPYTRIGGDAASAVQIAIGSSGVPETFVVDGKGVVRHQHIGDIGPQDLPEIRAALAAAQ